MRKKKWQNSIGIIIEKEKKNEMKIRFQEKLCNSKYGYK